MAKEPVRRYASAEHLAADLERYVEGRPVKARPDSRRYRFRKFVRRHRTLVTVLALLFLSLIGGMAAVAWQAAVARRQRDVAETARRESDAVTGFLMELFEATDPRQSGLDSLTVTTLLRHGLDRVNTLDHQPLLQARLLDALARVHQGMGRHDEARELFERSLALQQRHLRPRDPALAQSYIGLALNYRQQNELAPAESLITLALALEREGLHPSDPVRIRGLLTAANIAVATAQLPKGEDYSREALAIARATLPAGDPLLSESIRVMGSLLVRQGKTQEAVQTYQEYVDLNRRIHGPSHPITATTMVHLGNVYELTLGQPAVAESIYREALAILEPAWGREHPALIHSRESLARVLSKRGAYAAAESLQRVNLNTVIRYSGRETAAVAHGLAGVSHELLLQGKIEPAARMAEEALALHRRTTRPDDPDIASTMFILARSRLAQHRNAEALELVRQGIELRERAYGQRHQLVAISFEFLALMHRELGQQAEADSLLKRALSIMEQVGGPNHPDYIRVKQLLAGGENREP
jgi:serine/threonine-protein kinase